MKKLMITLSAAAMAFGLFADGVTFPVGENFNASTNIPATITGATGTDTAVSTNAYTYTQQLVAGLPDQFNESDPGNNLNIKTAFNSPVCYSPFGSAQTLDATHLYFDSLVKFTACDEAPDMSSYAGAKLVVWVKEEEDGNTVTKKLMVTAGLLDSELVPTAQNYDCGDPADYNIASDTDWCRLTIKVVKDITPSSGVTGFVIFVNGTPVTISTPKNIGIAESALTGPMSVWRKNDHLFPSLIGQNATITEVGFAGQGAVDDLSFTKTEPTNASHVQFALDQDPPIATVDGVECTTPAAINAALAAADGTKDIVVQLAAGMTFSNADGMNFAVAQGIESANFYLDLKGQTITAGEDCYAISVAENCTLTITNSVAGGKVVGAVMGYGSLVIQDGTFDGAVSPLGAAFEGEKGAYITGGAFLAEDNSGLADYSVFDPNMGLVQEGDYLVVAQTSIPKHFFIYVVDNVAVSNEYEEGQAITPPGNPTPAKNWETFVGWQPAVPATMGTADITVTAQFKFLDGEGTAAAPWQITTEADLLKLQAYVAGGQTTAGKVFEQTANIALTSPFAGIGLENGKDTATSTGFDDAAFQGTYNGAGFQITGLQLTKGAKGTAHDYAGLFNSIYQATIKNVSVGITGTGWAGAAPADSKEEWAGAPIVGVCKASLIENCSTLAGTFTAKKAASGIAAYVMGGSTLKACTNNLNIVSEGNEKAAGLIACAQKTVTGVENGTIVYVEDCANYGNVTVPNNKDRAGGFVSYTDDVTVTFKGDCTFSGTLTGNGANVQSLVNLNSGNVAVDAGAVIKVPAGYKTVNQKAQDGTYFATVDNGVATLVKNAAVVKGGSYKAMATGATAPAIELAADEQIVFDESLFTVTATAITAASGCDLEDTKSGNIRTIKAKTSAPAEDWDHPVVDPAIPGTKAEDAWPSLKDTALAQADAAKLVTWAKDTTKGNITFDKADEILVDAFLLDCANTAGAVATAKAAFKVTSITQDKDGNWVATVGEAGDGEAYKNGFINIVPYELEGAGDDAEFFQATLTLQPAAKE